jgi:hypothetical protein
MPLPSYEKLGSFYLGREVDPSSGKPKADLLLYDSRDLTTHAVCVGMTGSGKTGLCLALLEEAGIDGVPAIAIDPKGDLGNLMLTFPQLRPEDFAPWVDAGEAARKGQTSQDFAAATAATWRKGLGDWEQDGERIQRFRDAVEVAIYTPGSASGRPLSVLRSFAAPRSDGAVMPAEAGTPPELRADPGAVRERIAATVSGLLGLVGIDADPIKSREHILLSTLIDRAWSEGRDLDLTGVIQGIQKPPFDKIGVFDLETFYPAKERLGLAMAINNLIAAPGFAAWMQGEALDVQRLLYTDAGKPRISIISIAHLNDAERMFVVTLLLGEVVAWMRRQSGTSSLRALLYMDEIFGYFPPTATPPAKQPLMTLMKQGRAFGLGVVLATQNPVDLDYKGLSNAGTWLIGRLQTERDKARVVEGLLGAGGDGLDKAQVESLLANLGNRVFLMRNVHDDAAVLFQTRWALSYLRGPLTLPEIARLPNAAPTSATPRASPPGASQPVAAAASAPASSPNAKAVVPSGVAEYYLKSATATDAATTYVPRVLGVTRLHFVDKASGLDKWETRSYLAPMSDDGSQPDWSQADVAGDMAAQLASAPTANARFTDAPAALLRAQNYQAWRTQVASFVNETALINVLRSQQLGMTSNAAESEGDFRARIALALREKRDSEIDKLRSKYAPKLNSIDEQIRRAEDRVAREQSQLSQQKMSTAISIGASIFGALLGSRRINATNIGRVGTAARSASRIGRESDDVTRASESREVLAQRRSDLANELQEEVNRLQNQFEGTNATLDQLQVRPRKSEIDVQNVALVWVPTG